MSQTLERRINKSFYKKDIPRERLSKVANVIYQLTKFMPQSMDIESRAALARRMATQIIKTSNKGGVNSANVKGTLSYDYWLRSAERVVRAAEMVQDDPSKSWTTTKVSDTAKDKEQSPQSIYQTKDQCISGILGQNPAMSSQDASNYCDQIFGNAQKQALKRKQADDLSDCISNCDENDQACIDDCNNTSNAKKSGLRKQASVLKVPSWITAADIDTSHIHNTNNLRSASEQNYLKTISEGGMEYSLSRIPERRRQLQEQRNQSNLKSASQNKPAWAKVLEI